MWQRRRNNSLLLILLAAVGGCRAGAFLDMLDGMQGALEEEGMQFDRDFYSSLTACFDEIDADLLESHDAAWAGIVDYAATGGGVGDPWPTCAEPGIGQWIEDNCTTQTYGAVPIREPCNYASNIAYYHTAMEICRRPEPWSIPADYVNSMFLSYAFLGHGSSFFHMSQTRLGEICDMKTNDLFIYVAHQASVLALEPLDNSIIHELSYTPRAKSALAITSDLVDTFKDTPVEGWADAWMEVDMPEIRIGFCGFVSTLGILTLEEETFDAIVEWAFENIVGLDDEIRELCIENYVPLVRNATAHVTLNEIEKTRLKSHFAAVIAKFAYAFLWQEGGLVGDLGGGWFLTPEGNEQGAEVLPLFNEAVNVFLNYEYYNDLFQLGENVYPGEDWCNPTIPHAKWHLECGIALADLTFLADEVHSLFQKYQPQLLV